MNNIQFTDKYVKIYFNCKAFHPTIYTPFFNKILKKAKIMDILIKEHNGHVPECKNCQFIIINCQ